MSLQLAEAISPRAYLAAAEARAMTLPPPLDRATVRPIASVGVVGAGLMGAGIALAALQAGLSVRLWDQSAEALERGVAHIDADLGRQAAKGRMTEAEARAARERLTLVADLAAFSDVDMVIEAVFESMEVKRAVFARLDAACRADCVLASNTSTLDLDRIAAATSRPQSVIGLHFFSPANVMRLLEIVRGRETAPEIIATAMAFAGQIGKVGVLVGNCYGFAANRMIEGFGREANFMLLEGATPQAIDAALVGFGMAMGPLRVADVVGVDVPYRARQENSQAAPGDAGYYRMANRLVEAGHYGCKTGRGYYAYPRSPREPEADPELMALAAREAQALGVAARDLDADEIVDRCILPIINEGARVLEDGIAQRASDLDVIYVSGFGFPASLGGPMAYADRRGLADIVARLEAFADRYGDAYWKPADLLVSLARSGGAFTGGDVA